MIAYHPKLNRNRDVLETYFDIRITHSLDEFKRYQGEKFFLLTIFDIWAANSTDTKKEIIWEHVFSLELINELKLGKYPILFDSISEGCIKSSFDTIEDFCQHINVSPQNVYICLANPQSIKLNRQSYPSLSQYNFFSFDRFELDAVQIGSSMGDLIYKVKFNDRKRFLFLNRRYSVDRAYLYFKFHEFNLLDNMHCTFKLDNIYSDIPVTLQNVIADLQANYKASGASVIEHINQHVDYFSNSLPNEIKTKMSPIYNIDDKKSFLYSFWNLAAHNSTDIGIVTETFRNQLGISEGDIHYKTHYFITEKTYRTILMKQPFILFSNPYALKYLKTGGYKTFAPFIDESYDNIENLADRQNAIINEVRRLDRMSDTDFAEMMEQIQEIVTYNYNNLMSKKTNKFKNTEWSDDKFKTYFKEINKELTSSTLIKWHNKY